MLDSNLIQNGWCRGKYLRKGKSTCLSETLTWWYIPWMSAISATGANLNLVMTPTRELPSSGPCKIWEFSDITLYTAPHAKQLSFCPVFDDIWQGSECTKAFLHSWSAGTLSACPCSIMSLRTSAQSSQNFYFFPDFLFRLKGAVLQLGDCLAWRDPLVLKASQYNNAHLLTQLNGSRYS